MNEGTRSQRRSRFRMTGLVVMLILFAAPIAHSDSTIFSDGFFGFAGDNFTRGFYLSSYPGTNLGRVTLGYTASVAGGYISSLTARLGAYNGPLIGTQTITSSVVTKPSETLVTYNFGGVPVPTGSIVTFTQQMVSGPGDLFFDTGVAGPAGITETEGTTPPLDTFRRSSVGIIITQQDVPTTPLPPSLVLVLTGLACAGLYSFRRQWHGV